MSVPGGSAGAQRRSDGKPLVRLAPDCSLKLLEEPALYNRATDELYIVNGEALAFLKSCIRGAPLPEAADDLEFVDYCLDEGLLQMASGISTRQPHVHQSPEPSLRYLLLHITDRCNLGCRHCFLGEAGRHELTVHEIAGLADQFEDMQGLRLLVSGGEPLLHPDFWEIHDYLGGKDLRTVLMTNGTLIDEEMAARLSVQEVQISLDGMKDAHDFIRGAGAFEKSVAAVKSLRASGREVSIATMIHSRDLDDFDKLEDLVKELGAREWSIDLPSATGRLAQNPGLIVDPATAGPLMGRSFGGAIHEPLPGFACGAHLMAVMAEGNVARCGFYADEPVGTIAEGLAACWRKVTKISLGELECDCRFIDQCRGGCRFRARGYNKSYGADLCQCYRYGVLE